MGGVYLVNTVPNTKRHLTLNFKLNNYFIKLKNIWVLSLTAGGERNVNFVTLAREPVAVPYEDEVVTVLWLLLLWGGSQGGVFLSILFFYTASKFWV
jgi:hypothetical protein